MYCIDTTKVCRKYDNLEDDRVVYQEYDFDNQKTRRYTKPYSQGGGFYGGGGLGPWVNESLDFKSYDEFLRDSSTPIRKMKKGFDQASCAFVTEISNHQIETIAIVCAVAAVVLLCMNSK